MNAVHSAGRRVVLRRLSAIAVALAASAAMFVGAGSQAQAQEPGKLATSYIGTGTATLPFFIAQDKGYFAEANLEVTGASYNTAPYAQAVAGEIQILSTEHSAALQASVGGLELVFLVETSRLRDGVHQFVVRGDSPIQTAEDLKGKRIGFFNLVGNARFALDALLKKAGIDRSEVEVVEIALSGLGPALELRNVDVAHLPGVHLDTARKVQDARTIADFADLGLEGMPQGAYYTTRAAYDADKDKFHRFIEAYNRAVADAVADPELLRDYYVRISKLDPEVANRLPLPSTPVPSEPQRIQLLADRMFEAGLLDRKVVAGEGNLGFADIYKQ